jgi:hypothetical protein
MTTTNRKYVALGDIITEDEFHIIMDLIANADGPAAAVDAIATQVITPVLERINTTTSQENDPRYIAHMILGGIAFMAEVADKPKPHQYV